MAEVKSITISAGSYTAISAGQPNVSFRVKPGGQVRYTISSTAPATTITDYIHADATSGWLNFGSLAATDNVYAMSGAQGAVVEVIRG